MNSTAATCAPGSSITSCKISSDKTYAFLEMRSVEEASNAMAFDGIVFKDVHLKVTQNSLLNLQQNLMLSYFFLVIGTSYYHVSSFLC